MTCNHINAHWALVIAVACGIVLASFAPVHAQQLHAGILSTSFDLDAISPAMMSLDLGLLLLIGCVSFMMLGAVILHRRAGRASAEVHRLESLFDVLDEGIAVCSGMQVITANTSLCRLIGIEPDHNMDLMLSSFIRDTDVIDRLLSDEDVQLESELFSITDERVAIEITGRTFIYSGQPQRLFEIRDIRDRHESQKRINFLAQNDTLTGLPNREVMRARLNEIIDRGQCCAAIWIDLDRFKDVNDIHGHGTGDAMLQLVASKLRDELPAGTMISRLGGDEFVVICETISDPREGRLIGQQLRRLLNRPIDLGHLTLHVGASIGVAVFPEDASNADDLLKNADLALYQAKTSGRARCRNYDDALGQERQRRMVLSEQLPIAIANGEIETYFQPLVNAIDYSVNGFETLARWFHPDFGPIPPNEFVRIAEDTGTITKLTDLIIRKAIDAAKHWPSHVRLAVNVSPVQINPELIDLVREIIKSSGFDPRRLELEVTEDVLIKDFDQTAGMFARLRGMGVQVAMDDFGSGFTSLSNLRQLNFERMKIDRIFTNELPNHRRAAAIVRSLFVLARELDLDVTVEGVETIEQFTFLQQNGCQEVQGFLFSKPQPISAWTGPASLQFAPIGQQEVASSHGTLINFGQRKQRAS